MGLCSSGTLKNFISVVHYLFYLRSDLVPKLNFALPNLIFKHFRKCLNPLSAARRKWSKLPCCISHPVGSISRWKLPSTAWHPFVPHFHSPAVTISVASPHMHFSILFNLLSLFINNFRCLFGVFYFPLLTRFSWFCMLCLRPNSHFISPVSKRLCRA